MEHHSNIVPWQMICGITGAKLVVIPMDDRGALDLDAYRRLLGARTRIVAVTEISNALGTINPIAAMVPLAHAVGAKVLVDGAQAAAHLPVDVRALDCDFYAFSGHKVYAPTGIGVLYGKRELLEAMPPWQGGGDMIETVSFEGTVFNQLPYKFEAGTPHIAGAHGLGVALDWLSRFDWAALLAHEAALLAHAMARVSEIKGLTVIGTAPHKAAVLSFHIPGAHAHDVGTLLDLEGIAVRSGHHCAMPVMARFGVAATARASFALYNTEDEVDGLIAGLKKAVRLLA
jgi:cysteine desulfurase/selenocysteine lyase